MRLWRWRKRTGTVVAQSKEVLPVPQVLEASGGAL